MKTIVVLVSGIPATGKTTTCESFKDTYSSEYDALVHICFDHLFAQFQLFNSSSQFNPNEWKECRENMLQLTQFTLQRLTEGDAATLPSQFLSEYTSQYINLNLQHKNGICVVILDDNFQYSSMRDEYARMCKKFQVHFSIIILTAPLNTCLERNKNRNEQIDEKTLIEMNNKIEILSREKDVTVLDTSKLTTSHIIEVIHQNINSTLEKPLPVYISQEEINQMKDKDRQLCNENAVHQMDLKLRKKVGELIKNQLNGTSSDKATVIKLIGEERRKVLQEFSQGLLTEDPIVELEKRVRILVNKNS
jgi:tRNA uridine 5-carbamoylmethylation protein Kti12